MRAQRRKRKGPENQGLDGAAMWSGKRDSNSERCITVQSGALQAAESAHRRTGVAARNTKVGQEVGQEIRTMTTRERTLIWASDRNAWWGPNRCGYTTDAGEAGRYTPAEAGIICADSNRAPGALSVPVPESAARGWLEAFQGSGGSGAPVAARRA